MSLKQAEGGAGLWAPAWAVPRIWDRCILSGSSWLLPLLGCGRSGVIVTKFPTSFCEDAGGLGLEGWVM